MEAEKKYVAGWWFWILLLVVLSLPIIWALNTAGLLGRTVAERVIFEQSYQKKAGDAAKVRMFRAQEASLVRRLQDGSLSEGQRAGLEAQLDAIRIQIRAVE